MAELGPAGTVQTRGQMGPFKHAASQLEPFIHATSCFVQAIHPSDHVDGEQASSLHWSRDQSCGLQGLRHSWYIINVYHTVGIYKTRFDSWTNELQYKDIEPLMSAFL